MIAALAIIGCSALIPVGYSIVELTSSFALDRIDQRQLPLDHIYQHANSGRGVTVYVFDGGISKDHPELAGRVRRGFTAFPDDPVVCNAHGTAVAGAIAGSTLGVAPEAQLVDVKIIQCEKLRGTVDAIVDAVHWVIRDHEQHPGPAVANWSFVVDTANQHVLKVDAAIGLLRSAGIPVVVAAGNVDLDACRISPANVSGAIVVGATALDTTDRRAPNTAWGACIDLYAPGDSVLLPSLDNSGSPRTQLWNGTSMAAGYVSGAAALYLERNPQGSPDDVAKYLERMATKNVITGSRSETNRLLFVN